MISGISDQLTHQIRNLEFCETSRTSQLGNDDTYHQDEDPILLLFLMIFHRDLHCRQHFSRVKNTHRFHGGYFLHMEATDLYIYFSEQTDFVEADTFIPCQETGMLLALSIMGVRFGRNLNYRRVWQGREENVVLVLNDNKGQYGIFKSRSCRR